MGRPKATLPFRGTSFVRTIIGMYQTLHCEPIIVVIGAHAAAVVDDIRTCEVTAVMNESFMEGQLSSILAGLGACEHLNPGGVLIHPVDHPLVSPSTLSAILGSWNFNPEAIVIPVHSGKRGHPVIFGSAFFPELREASPDTGAREVVWAHGDIIREVIVNDAGILQNIDTPEGYENIA